MTPNEPESLGPIKVNLVMVYDNEKGYEFRAQLEVHFADSRDAGHADHLIKADSSAALTEAAAIVQANVHRQATQTFRTIMEMAFAENIRALQLQGK